MRQFPFAALAACLLLAACGGGGGGSSAASTASTSSSSSGGTTTTTTPTLTNLVSVVVDGGPASLQSGPNGVIQGNTPYITLTLCAPGSATNCQTIDHVEVDTGSVGLRVPASVLSASLLSAMTNQTASNGDAVGECYQYIDGYLFGSVRLADVKIGGESVASMPLQVAGDSGAFATTPSSCSSGGGADLSTVANLGANAIIGIGVTALDCGSACASAGGQGAAFYYDCPASGCSSIIARSAATTAPFQQVPNPVAAMTTDNNGSMMSFPAVSSGLASLTGALYFGIGTQTNNGLGSATVFTTTTSSSPLGAGLFTIIYGGRSLPDSFIDSGSSIYFFEDSSITACTSAADKGYYCPSSALTLNLTLQGQNGVSAALALSLQNAAPLLATTDAVLPAIGGNPAVFSFTNPYPTSFDLGMPFFYGRNVFTGIEGRTAGSATGPFYAY